MENFIGSGLIGETAKRATGPIAQVPSLSQRACELEDEVARLQNIVERLEGIIDRSINGPRPEAPCDENCRDANVIPLPNRLNYCRNILSEINTRLHSTAEKLQEYLG